MLVKARTDDVQLLDVRQHCSFADFMVLATGRSHRHVITAARAIAYQVVLTACVKSHVLLTVCHLQGLSPFGLQCIALAAVFHGHGHCLAYQSLLPSCTCVL